MTMNGHHLPFIPAGPRLIEEVAIPGSDRSGIAEKELLVLDAAMADARIVGDLIGQGVRAEIFTEPGIAVIWKAIEAVYLEEGANRSRSSLISAITKYTDMAPEVATRQVDAAGGGCFVEVQVKYAADSLVDDHRRRSMIFAGSRLSELTIEGADVSPWLKLIDDLNRSGKRAAAKSLNWSNMDTVQPETVNWLWPDRFPSGMLSVIAGTPGLGKSMVTIDMIARTSNGKPWPDGSHNGLGPRDAIIVAIEDDPAVMIRPRLDAAGADARRVHYLRSIQGADGRERSICDLIPHLPAIEEKVLDVHAALVVFDPIGGLLGGRDHNSMNEVREGLDLLVDLARKTEAAVVVVHHLNKGSGGGGPAIHRLSGSTGFSAVPRAIWSVVRDPDDDEGRLMVPTKSNLSPTREALPFNIEKMEGCLAPSIRWGEAFEVDDIDELVSPSRRRSDGDAGSRSGETSPKIEEAARFLYQQLAGGPRKATEIEELARQQGITAKSLQRARSVVSLDKTKESGHWLWSLAG